MNKALLALAIALIAQIACGSSAPVAKTADDYVQEYGGNVDVFNRILALSDCLLLQEEFDIASGNNELATPGTPEHKESLGYMTAADDRMKALSCYGQSNLAPANTIDISIIVAETAAMALTQTVMAIVPTVAITSTNLPTLTQPVLPTLITIPTSESSPVPTNTVIFILPTQAPPAGGSTCSCSGDSYNCPDFSSHSSAQSCFNYCVEQGAGDIHRLDQDNDGVACENN